MTILFQILVLKYPNKAFFVPSIRIFVFAPNFAIRKIQGHWFQLW